MVAVTANTKGMLAVKPLARFTQAYVYSTALLFVVAGLVIFFATDTNVTQLRQGNDPLLRMAPGTVLLAAGVLHLVLGVYLFAARDLLNRAVMILWAGLVHLAYRLGMQNVHPALNFPELDYLCWRMGIAATTLYLCWLCFILYLWLGSIICLFSEWERFQQIKAETFVERWRIMREQGHWPLPAAMKQTGAPLPPQEQKVSKSPQIAASPERASKVQNSNTNPVLIEFKIACPNCGQHIKCDKEYFGKEINCPACQKPIHVPRLVSVS